MVDWHEIPQNKWGLFTLGAREEFKFKRIRSSHYTLYFHCSFHPYVTILVLKEIKFPTFFNFWFITYTWFNKMMTFLVVISTNKLCEEVHPKHFRTYFKDQGQKQSYGYIQPASHSACHFPHYTARLIWFVYTTYAVRSWLDPTNESDNLTQRRRRAQMRRRLLVVQRCHWLR